MPRKGTPRKPGVQPRYIDSDQMVATVEPKQLTAKQQRFCELLATGVEKQEAAQQAGLKNKSSIYRTLTNPYAQRYLSTIRNESRAITAYNVSVAMEEAAQVIEFAKQKGNAMAYCKAVELRSKLSGLLIDRVQVEKVDLTKALEEANNRVTIDVPVIDQQVMQQLSQSTKVREVQNSDLNISTGDSVEKANEVGGGGTPAGSEISKPFEAKGNL